MANRIDALAQRVEGDPFFLASALADYAQSEGLDDSGLAQALGISREALGPLRLCRRPRTQANLFREDIEKIAMRFEARKDVLAEAVRRSDVLTHLRDARAGEEQGTLIAARDRQDYPNAGDESGGEAE